MTEIDPEARRAQLRALRDTRSTPGVGSAASPRRRHHAALGLDADEAQRHVGDAQADVEAGLERPRRAGDAVAVEAVVSGGEEGAEIPADLEDVLLLEPGRLRLAFLGRVARVGRVRQFWSSEDDAAPQRFAANTFTPGAILLVGELLRD